MQSLQYYEEMLLAKEKKMASVLILTFKQRAKGAKSKRNVLFLPVIKRRPV